MPRPALARPALLLAALLLPAIVHAQGGSALAREIDAKASQLEAKVVAWRRDLHQHPELSNRETRTAGVVAAHLKSLGIEVTTGVAKTGVVGVLKGARPGPVVALRADMDALPVAEETTLPFKSTVRSTFAGQDVARHQDSLRRRAKVLVDHPLQTRGEGVARRHSLRRRDVSRSHVDMHKTVLAANLLAS